jgi:hypothetical protein
MDRREDSDYVDQLAPRAECFLLCDHARAENGKLYILGGGWDQVFPERLPVSFPVGIAGKVILPGKMALESVGLRIDMVDDDGRKVGDAALDRRLRATPTADLPLDPDGILPEAPALFAISANLELRAPGRVSLRLLVDDAVVATTRLTVVGPASAIDGVSQPGEGARTRQTEIP